MNVKRIKYILSVDFIAGLNTVYYIKTFTQNKKHKHYPVVGKKILNFFVDKRFCKTTSNFQFIFAD